MKENTGRGCRCEIAQEGIALEDVVAPIKLPLGVVSYQLVEEDMGAAYSIALVESKQSLLV